MKMFFHLSGRSCVSKLSPLFNPVRFASLAEAAFAVVPEAVVDVV